MNSAEAGAARRQLVRGPLPRKEQKHPSITAWPSLWRDIEAPRSLPAIPNPPPRAGVVRAIRRKRREAGPSAEGSAVRPSASCRGAPGAQPCQEAGELALGSLRRQSQDPLCKSVVKCLKLLVPSQLITAFVGLASAALTVPASGSGRGRCPDRQGGALACLRPHRPPWPRPPSRPTGGLATTLQHRHCARARIHTHTHTRTHASPQGAAARPSSDRVRLRLERS